MYSTHRKWGVALLALAATAVNQGLLHGSALHWTQIALAAATALGVRAVPNDAPAFVPVDATLPTPAPEPSSNVTVLPPDPGAPGE